MHMAYLLGYHAVVPLARTSSLLMNLLASTLGKSETVVTLCGVMMLLCDHMHVDTSVCTYLCAHCYLLS